MQFLCKLTIHTLIMSSIVMKILNHLLFMSSIVMLIRAQLFVTTQAFAPDSLRRYDIHISQWLPDDLDHKITNFQSFVIWRRKEYNYPFSHIGNADQMPLTFDLPRGTTIFNKGDKSISINTTGHEKDRFTVMLAYHI